MLHMTVGIFGNAEYAKKLGKEGTKNDIGIYNHGSSDGIFTYVTVCSEKIAPLLQAVNMIDVPVFAINQLTAAVGEQIIAVSEFGFDKGFFILDGVIEDQIRPIIKGTCLDGFVFLKDHNELAMELKKLRIDRKHGELAVPIDNHFNVKSVGTVILGIVRSGTVKKYDKVVVEPVGVEVMIKGIQSQDKDIDVAEAGTRVGLNLKGIESDDLKRGYIVGKAEKTSALKLRFTKSRYSKEPPKENDPVFVSSGLQAITAQVKSVSGDTIELVFDGYIAYEKNTKFLIASTKQNIPRILGHGTLF